MGTAPLLRGVARELAAVDIEGVATDAIELTGIHQHVSTHARYFPMHLRNEVGDRRGVSAESAKNWTLRSQASESLRLEIDALLHDLAQDIFEGTRQDLIRKRDRDERALSTS